MNFQNEYLQGPVFDKSIFIISRYLCNIVGLHKHEDLRKATRTP